MEIIDCSIYKSRFYFRKKTMSILIFFKLFNNILDQKHIKIIEIFRKKKSSFIILIIFHLKIEFIELFFDCDIDNA